MKKSYAIIGIVIVGVCIGLLPSTSASPVEVTGPTGDGITYDFETGTMTGKTTGYGGYVCEWEMSLTKPMCVWVDGMVHVVFGGPR